MKDDTMEINAFLDLLLSEILNDHDFLVPVTQEMADEAFHFLSRIPEVSDEEDFPDDVF